MELRYSKLHPDAMLYKKHENDAGYDLKATNINVDVAKGIIAYHTGIALEIPDGYVGLLFPRSSISRMQLSLANCVGVIDSTYRGEIIAKMRPTNNIDVNLVRYEVGDRVCQLLIVPLAKYNLKEVPHNELTKTKRGEGGFGSTGN